MGPPLVLERRQLRRDEFYRGPYLPELLSLVLVIDHIVFQK